MNAIPARSFGHSLDQALLETLAYFDVFDYPVRLEELHRYLHGLRSMHVDLEYALRSPGLAGRIDLRHGYYVLAGRRSLVEAYEASARRNGRGLRRALRYGRLLARLPFIRMVTVTGSVAMQNGGAGSDYDYLLVTAPGRLWLGRAFAIVLGRWASVRGETLCPNVILSEKALVWGQQDLYAAHELTQMIPVAGQGMYARLRDRNQWTQAYLPNALGAPRPVARDRVGTAVWQRLSELLLLGGLGDRLESLEMDRKVARFRKQAGFGAETAFNADVCQGNFQHHGERTRQAFESRLADLGLTSAALWTAVHSPSAPPVAASERSRSRAGRDEGGSGIHLTNSPATGNG